MAIRFRKPPPLPLTRKMRSFRFPTTCCVRRRDLVQPLDLENTIRYGVGARYAYSDRLTLRAGASYEWSERLSLDFSYGWIRITQGDTEARENPAGTQHRASESSRGTLHNVGAQMNYSF